MTNSSLEDLSSTFGVVSNAGGILCWNTKYRNLGKLRAVFKCRLAEVVFVPVGFFAVIKVRRMGSIYVVQGGAFSGSLTKHFTTYGVKFKLPSGNFQGEKTL